MLPRPTLNENLFFESWKKKFRQTSNVNISETVYPNDLKFNLERDMIWDYSHLKFQVIRVNRFRDIDVGSWPKKTTEKKRNIFLDQPL